MRDKDAVDNKVVEKIAEKLDDEDKEVVKSAVDALAKLRDKDAVDNKVVEKIAEKLRYENEIFVLSVMEALEDLADKVNNTIVTRLIALNTRGACAVLEVLYQDGRLEFLE